MPQSPSNESEVTLAFVIPWVGRDTRGGAELQGWETARTMAGRGYRVEILTTCSRSFLHRWDDNYYQPGEETIDGVTVRRFLVENRDERVFGSVNQALLSGLKLSGEEEEAFVRHNINSRDMYRFLEEKADDYLFIFMPYLYGTTLAGASIRPDRSLIMPCFHDEAYAYMEVTKEAFAKVKGLLYLTPEEATAVEKAICAPVRGKVVGGGINTGTTGSAERFRLETGINESFILYVGRIDRGKNTHILMEYFLHWADRCRERKKLVLIGAGGLPVPADEQSVIRLEVRDDRQKMDACAAAMALCQPSVNESFSRVIMEAWLNGVPVVVNGECDVTREHCKRSGGGLYFRDYFEFAEVLDLLSGDDALRRSLGAAGRGYVLENYNWDIIIQKLLNSVEDLTGLKPALEDNTLTDEN